MILTKLVLIVAFFLLNLDFSSAQIVQKYSLEPDQNPVKTIVGNGVTDIFYFGGSLWLGTGNGLSRTGDQGQSWYNFREADGIGKGGITAMAFYQSTIWIATGYDTVLDDNTRLPVGGGIGYSDDNGETWHHFVQPGVTNIQNITYDMAVLDSVVWIASFGGGLKRSDDRGESWVDAPPDSFIFNPSVHLNHRAFSIVVADTSLWVGTAKGINRSDDNGENWINFNHQNQAQPISGNFVVALGYQTWQDHKILWASTRQAEGEDEFNAVSFSEDNGATWKTTLEDEFVHNFGFGKPDGAVYAPSDNGLFVSHDFGENWEFIDEIMDQQSGDQLFTHEFYSAEVSPDNLLWVGTADGMGKSADGGSTWTIFHTFETLLDDQNVSETYAYPNPFSPMRHNQFRDQGHVRFHYRVDQSGSVSVTVYDFSMKEVCSVEEGVYRIGNNEYDAIWDGRNNDGDKVANGVYFYRVDLPGGKSVFGKVMVLD